MRKRKWGVRWYNDNVGEGGVEWVGRKREALKKVYKYNSYHGCDAKLTRRRKRR